ncbi:sensor histidine kinase [Streptomyces sp. NBC_01363]|uniref:sensor histidine kinase n=1 Tax=Streptomyces sp. NBC_01363 TaxID=2903840 RepID=UPI0022503FCA|nr:histidine kinase [Streptomyces sp. NBC_01363]MCX4733753.1 histidine kinase [Streptomyces sp. NBC_01363]
MQGDSADGTTGHPPGLPDQRRDGTGAPVAHPRPWLRRAAGALLGCCTALTGLLYFAVPGGLSLPFVLCPRTRLRALALLSAGARGLTGLERLRRSVFFGDVFPAHRASDQDVLRYLAARTGAGALYAGVLALLGYGAVLAGLLAAGVARDPTDWQGLLPQAALGGVLLFLDLQGLFSLNALDTRLARDHFGPSERELLERRIAELAASRASVLRAVDAERRRIERDLHDGVQQRLVALAMLLGRARRNRTPEQAELLLRQAHQASQEVLTELREVAWRVYPSPLDDLGLEEALGGVAQRCGIPLHMEFALPLPLPRPVETAAYFVVCEAVTNAAKHSRATRIRVSVRGDGNRVSVSVQDNGTGGADPLGGGLSGLRGRVEALDGRLYIDSPCGGPTTITAELPCA